MDRAEVGRRGEAVAARFYQKQGCLLVAHNYSLPVGSSARPSSICNTPTRVTSPCVLMLRR